MLEIGRINRLRVKRLRDYGAQLDGGEAGDVLLPGKHLPEGCQPGDELEVFVYQDRTGHLRATSDRPLAQVGEFAHLRVVANTPSGVYLDWGLEKDLLVPKREQRAPMAEGKFYVVYLFLDDKSNRITASTKLERFLSKQPPPYKEGDRVELLIYDRSELGFRAIVDQAHIGMLYRQEVFHKLAVGQQLAGYVKKVRDDQRLDLILQKPGGKGVDEVAKNILRVLKKEGGHLAITDNSRPQEIYALFAVSKKTFKKAIGNLYKKRLITIDDRGIRLVR